VINDEERFQTLLDLAVSNVLSEKGGPFAACIVRNGIIVGMGTNSVTSDLDPTAHAEVNAIRDACKNLQTYDLSDCIIYSTCEPCPMCLAACYWSKIKEVKCCTTKSDATNAGFDDSFIYSEFDKCYGARKLIHTFVEVENATDPFITWKYFINRKEY